MDRSGFEKIEEPKPMRSDHKKLFLIRLPKDTNFKVLHNAKVDISEEHKITSLRSIDNEEYNVTCNKSVSNDIFNIRSITSDNNESHNCTTSAFVGSISISNKKRLMLSDGIDPVVPEYSKIEQLKGLKVRSLPSGSYSNVTDIWKKNLEAEVRANAITRNKTSSHDKNKSEKQATIEESGKKKSRIDLTQS